MSSPPLSGFRSVHFDTSQLPTGTRMTFYLKSENGPDVFNRVETRFYALSRGALVRTNSEISHVLFTRDGDTYYQLNGVTDSTSAPSGQVPSYLIPAETIDAELTPVFFPESTLQSGAVIDLREHSVTPLILEVSNEPLSDPDGLFKAFQVETSQASLNPVSSDLGPIVAAPQTCTIL